MIESYPFMSSHLGKNAWIVKNQSFESGICKVIGEDVANLDEEEMEALAPFRVLEESSNQNRGSLIERALKRLKKDSHSQKYQDLTFIPPTSNVCERLFSTGRYDTF